MRETIIYFFSLFLLLLLPSEAIQDCGPYCCGYDDFYIDIPCTDNYGGTPQDYEYGVAPFGTIATNPETGNPAVLIQAGELPCGEITTLFANCVCLSLDCTGSIELNVDICEDLTMSGGICRDFRAGGIGREITDIDCGPQSCYYAEFIPPNCSGTFSWIDPGSFDEITSTSAFAVEPGEYLGQCCSDDCLTCCDTIRYVVNDVWPEPTYDCRYSLDGGNTWINDCSISFDACYGDELIFQAYNISPVGTFPTWTNIGGSLSNFGTTSTYTYTFGQVNQNGVSQCDQQIGFSFLHPTVTSCRQGAAWNVLLDTQCCDCEPIMSYNDDCDLIIDATSAECESFLLVYDIGIGNVDNDPAFTDLTITTAGTYTLNDPECIPNLVYHAYQLDQGNSASSACCTDVMASIPCEECQTECTPGMAVIPPDDLSVCWDDVGFITFQLGIDWGLAGCFPWSGQITDSNGNVVDNFSSGNPNFAIGLPNGYGTFTITLTCQDTNNDCFGESYSNTFVISDGCTGCNCTVTPPNGLNGCVGDPITLTASFSGCATPIQSYCWNNGCTLGTGSSATFTPTTPGNYSIPLQITDANGCVSSENYSISVTDCGGCTNPCNPTGSSNGCNLIFSSCPGYNTFIGNTPVSSPWTVSGNGTYFITYTDPNGICSSVTLPIVVGNCGNPTCNMSVDFNFPSPTGHCFDTDGSFTLSSGAAYSVSGCSNFSCEWTPPSGPNEFGCTFTGDAADGYGNYILTVTCNDAGPCQGQTASDSFVLQDDCVNQTCNCTPFASYSNATCQFTINENCADYTWSLIRWNSSTSCSGGNQTILSNQNGSATYNVTTDGLYQVIFTAANGSPCNTFASECYQASGCEAPTCSCSVNITENNCIVSWNTSGSDCGNYNFTLTDGNGSSGGVGSSGSLSTTINGTWSITGTANGCAPISDAVFVSGCNPVDCNCNPSTTFNANTCQVCLSLSGSGCSNYDTYRIIGPNGFSQNVSNGGCVSVADDGQYFGNIRDLSGGTGCAEVSGAAVNVSGCDCGPNNCDPGCFNCSSDCNISLSNPTISQICFDSPSPTYNTLLELRVDYAYNCSSSTCCSTIDLTANEIELYNGNTLIGTVDEIGLGLATGGICGSFQNSGYVFGEMQGIICNATALKFVLAGITGCGSVTFDATPIIAFNPSSDLDCGCPSPLIQALSLPNLPTKITEHTSSGISEFDQTYAIQNKGIYRFEIRSHYREDEFWINNHETGCIQTTSVGNEKLKPYVYEEYFDAGDTVRIRQEGCTDLENSFIIKISNHVEH